MIATVLTMKPLKNIIRSRYMSVGEKNEKMVFQALPHGYTKQKHASKKRQTTTEFNKKVMYGKRYVKSSSS